MKLKQETKIYAILSVLCISSILFLTLYFGNTQNSNSLSPDKLIEQNINITLDNMLTLSIVAVPILLFIFYGILNLTIFITNSFRNKPIFEQFQEPTGSCLSNKKTFKLLFFITYFYLAIFLISMIAITSCANQAYILRVSLLANFITQLFVIFCVLKSIPPKSLGIKLSTKNFGTTLRFYSAILVILNITTLLLVLIGKKLGLEPQGQAAIYILLELKDPFLLFFFGFQIVILAPLSEELFFRGFIYSSIRNKLNVPLSVIITSIIFASLHGNLFGFFIIFILSIALCYIWEKTKNLTLTFLFHGLHNGLVFLAILIFKNFIV